MSVRDRVALAKRHFGLSPAAYRKRFCRASRPTS